VREEGLFLLRKAVGNNAKFHQDQWEAIESALSGGKTLLVQKTGWGKSIVYFIAAKLLRKQGKGITVIISPLLSLMRNQIEMAEKAGVKALTINSTNRDDWEKTKGQILKGECDILFISPERLGNEEFNSNILILLTSGVNGSIGMLVVDEAHCISDWGHDFRPDYRRIVRIVKNLPRNVPLLATTATANHRVINDIQEQLGEQLLIMRGPLMRESLRLQVIRLKDQAERLAWLYENINDDKMPGTGIIYCLTKRDCNMVAKWLDTKGISALPYHTSLSDNIIKQKELEEEREKLLMDNSIKVLVATVKLGMGFDKPDLGFVVHFQRPGSIIAYYQQIGRAGRKLDNANVVLLNGREDDEIQEYFINSAFPTQEEMEKVVKAIEDSSNGISQRELDGVLNMSQGRINNCLKMLEIDMIVKKEDRRYTRTLNEWEPDNERSRQVTEQRRRELNQMKELVSYDGCYMEFISKELDDPVKRRCGKCRNCIDNDFISSSVQQENAEDAIHFLRKGFGTIKPRKKYPDYKNISSLLINQEGRFLCYYGDAGWGQYVKEDKYGKGVFRDELVDASVELIKDSWENDPSPTWVTSVPSLRRPNLVSDFAKKVAKKLSLPYIDALKKIKETEEQKSMKNSSHQYENAKSGFTLTGSTESGPVLLIDDMVDSKWSLTVCGILLREGGSGEVYPFAIASSAEGEL